MARFNNLAFHMGAADAVLARKKKKEENTTDTSSDDGPGKLQVLIDDGGQKTAQKLYKDFINDNQMVSLPHFTIALDNFLLKQRGGKAMPPKSEDSDDDSSSDSDSDDSESTSSVEDEEEVEPTKVVKNKEVKIKKEEPEDKTAGKLTLDGKNRLDRIMARLAASK